MLTLVFTYLYPLLSISTVAGYLPQIKEFIMTKEAPKGFAVTGWLIWLGENFVTIGYGAIVLQDLMFCLMTSLDVLFIAATIILAIRAKRRYERSSNTDAAVKIDFIRAALC